MMLWIVVAGILILLLFYTVIGRHSSRSLRNAVRTFFGMLSLCALSAVSISFTTIYLASLLGEIVSLNSQFLSTSASISAFAVGLWITVHSIRTKPPKHLVLQHNKLKADVVRLCRVIVGVFFVALPSVTYLTLVTQYSSYPVNKLAENGTSLIRASNIVLTQFHVVFAATGWWAFIVVGSILSSTIIRLNLNRASALLLILPTMALFCLPYIVMMMVLAFDIMEMDFPAVATVYYMYFIWLAPGLGAILACIWIVGTYLRLGRRKGQSSGANPTFGARA